MKILQRYVLKEVLSPTLLALATLTFVLLLQIVYTRADEMAGALSIGMILRFLGYILPSLLSLTVPMALLTGVLLGIGRLTVDSEIKSMRTHGVQLLPVFSPIFALGAFAMIFELFNTLYLAPHLLNQSLELIDQLRFRMIESLKPEKFEDRFSTEGADVVIYFDRHDPQTGALRNVYLTLQGGPEGLGQDMTSVDMPSIPDLKTADPLQRTKTTPQKKKTHKNTEAPKTATPPAPQTPQRISVTFPVNEPQGIEFPAQQAETHDGRYTIEAWIRTTSGAPMTAVALWRNDQPAPRAWLGADAQGRLTFIHRADDAEISLLGERTRIADGRWHYAAAVRGDRNQWKLFLDGTLVAESQKRASKNSFDRMAVGAPGPTGLKIEPWSGELGEIRFSNQARTRTEIELNWNGGYGKELPRDNYVMALWQGKIAQNLPTATENPDEKTKNAPASLIKTVFLASSGRIQAEENSPRATLILTSGTIHFSRGRADPRYTMIAFEKMTQAFQLASDERQAGAGERKREVMTAGEIRRELSTRDKGKRGREIKAELLQRISLSIGCLTFVLIGVPLAIYVRPSGKSVGISIAFLLMGAYYGFLHYGIQISRAGAPFGSLVIFMPNLLLTILGGVLLYRTCFR